LIKILIFENLILNFLIKEEEEEEEPGGRSTPMA
jgi:hypothetical protein